MNTIKFAAVIVITLFAGTALAQSSKFAATYDNDIAMLDVSVNGGDEDCVLIDPDGEADSGDEYSYCSKTAGPIAEGEVASMHVAQWKELLLGMSAQVNLLTFTQAKGKNNAGTSTAIAEGAVRGGVMVVPTGTDASCRAAFDAYDAGAGNAFAAPGPVVFSSRRQELSVTTALDIVDADECDEIDGDGVLEEGECLADLLEIEGSVTVALGLDTTASHHFNFIEANMTSGWYDVIACYDLRALVAVSGADIDEDTQARSKVALGSRIITAQEVRATKNGIIDETGAD